ncbi:MAG: acetate--CoA ligase, partial [Thermodesulfobacteriota bacterium]|nr:acetate--CoA ligase [Thermodesulfobacteriota bacterium]
MLEHFFSPASVAIVGASRQPGKVGHDVLKNMMSYGYQGQIYPVNPAATEILGIKAYPNLASVPGPVDLVVICVPAPHVIQVVEECAARKIDSIVVITAGFKEVGPEGARLERELKDAINRYGIRMVGPNCVGLIDTASGVNASFAAGMPLKGNIGFFSQSGALCVAILDWSLAEDIGFSKFVSLGNKTDISEIEMLLALSEDPETKVVLGYLEGINDGLAFMDVARAVSKKKPIILIKSGTTASGAKAASSHTGALAGSEAAFQAAFRQSGVIRAHSINDLFNYALAFAYQPLPKGPNIAIITNSGGPGIIAADACDRSNLILASLNKETVDKLRKILPPIASFYNPVDIIGDAGAERYRDTLAVIQADDQVHAILVLLTPTAMVDVAETARAVAELAKQSPKPVFASFLGKKRVEEGRKILLREGIPHYNYPEDAIAAMDSMYRQRLWVDEPPRTHLCYLADRDKVWQIFDRVRDENRNQLIEAEAREVLQAYGFKVPANILARTSKEAVAAANSIGYPVVMKIASHQIVHKSDIGGVILGIKTAKEAERAFFEITSRARNRAPQAPILGVMVQEMITGGREVILGLSKDPQFGTLIMFGLGGVYVEVLKDVSFRVVPLAREDAREMVREIRSFPLLRGVRGEQSVDIEAVEEALLIMSQLAQDFPEIVEADVNPLLAKSRGEGVIAVD